MKFLKTKSKRILFWVLLPIVLFVILVIAFVSPLAKWAIEKYDTKYLGREIALDMAYVNPFTGKVYLKNVEIREANSDSIFFSAKGISANFEMLKMLSKTYEISQLVLTDPVGKIIQNEKTYNFDDLVKKFSSKDRGEIKKNKDPLHFNLLNIKIENGTFYYVERSIPVFYFIKNVHVVSGGKRWDSDKMDFDFSFSSGIGSGDAKGKIETNTGTADYKLATVMHRFDLSVLEQYVRDMANYGSVRGNVDADIKAEGNFKYARNLDAKGFLAINDFHIGKDTTDDYTSFKKLSLGIVQLNPENKKYLFDSISLQEPFFKYERYDHLDNLQYMFGQKGERVKEANSRTGKTNIIFQLGKYIQLLAKNFFKSDYKIKRLAIYDADFRYHDYALTEKFIAAVSPLTIIADSIERSERWVNLSLRSKINPHGQMGLDVSINPKDSSDFNFQFYLRRLPLAALNPYFITYTSFPMDRGIVEVTGDWTVRNGVINSRNNLLIIDPRINNRQRRNGAKWLPMRFFMFFVRDRGNVVDYEVPIHGDLKDPKFRLWDVIGDMVTNIFVKPVTVPYRTKVRNVENEIEKTLNLKWAMRGAVFSSPQEKFIKKIAEFLKENPGQVISVRPEFYLDKEKEYTLFFEAKKKYYLSAYRRTVSTLDADDSTEIERISVKDSAFTHFLNKRVGPDLHTVQEKCAVVVGEAQLNRKIEQLTAARKKVFMSFFSEDGLSKRVKMEPVKNTIPFNCFSLYRFSYKGNFPDELLEAYKEINELDNESPRDKFKFKRKRNKRLLDRK